VAYLAGMSLMGVYFSRRNVTTDEYFLGGRSFKGVGHRLVAGGHLDQLPVVRGLSGRRVQDVLACG